MTYRVNIFSLKFFKKLIDIHHLQFTPSCYLFQSLLWLFRLYDHLKPSKPFPLHSVPQQLLRADVFH